MLLIEQHCIYMLSSVEGTFFGWSAEQSDQLQQIKAVPRIHPVLVRVPLPCQEHFCG